MAKELPKETLEEEMGKVKRILEQLKRTQKAFTASFMSMKPRERALAARQILADHNIVANFIAKASRSNIGTTAFRFSVENIKLSYQSLTTLWRKTEKLLDAMSSSTGVPNAFGVPRVGDAERQTKRVMDDYVSKLKNAGKDVGPEMLQTFKTQLESSYEKAKEKFKGNDFSVQVIEQDGKIKVRFEPK
jgi:hypothetical protein